MTDTDRSLICCHAMTIMSGTLDKKEIHADAEEIYKLAMKSDWTPCAEGLPTNSARYKVTLQVGSEAGTWLETAIIPYRYCDGTGEWILPKSDWLIYGVIAWTKADEPYRADDTTGKVKEEAE